MNYRWLPILYGVVVMLTIFSGTMLTCRALGLNRGDAFYFAILICSAIAYFTSRRLMHKREE